MFCLPLFPFLCGFWDFFISFKKSKSSQKTQKEHVEICIWFWNLNWKIETNSLEWSVFENTDITVSKLNCCRIIRTVRCRKNIRESRDNRNRCNRAAKGTRAEKARKRSSTRRSGEKGMQSQPDGECKNCIRQIIWSQQAENGGKSTPMESDGENAIRATSRQENGARARKLTESSRRRHEGRLQQNQHEREDKLGETFWRRQLFMLRMTCSEHLFLAFFLFFWWKFAESSAFFHQNFCAL